MKNSILIKSYLLLVIILLSWGCKKDDEEKYDPPTIQVIIPSKGDSFQVFDTVMVKAEITHDKSITEISVTIIDDINNPVTKVKSVAPLTNNYTLEEYLIISNDKLKTGNYEVMVRASDGNANSASYVSVKINGVPVRFSQLWAITNQNDLKTYITRYDSVYNEMSTHVLNYDYKYSVLNSATDQFILGTPSINSIISYEADSMNIIWQEAVSLPYPPVFDMFLYESYVYVSLTSGLIKAYNDKGIVQVSTPVNKDRVPEKIYRGNKYIVSYQTSRSSYKKYLVANFNLTGAHAGEREIFMEVVGFGEKNKEEMYFFGNRTDSAWVMVYEVLTNSDYPVKFIPGAILRDLDYLGNNKYILATNNGLYEFRSDNESLVKTNPATGIKIVRYDQNTGILYAADDDKIRVYDYETGGIVNTLTPNFTMQNIHIRNNR